MSLDTQLSRLLKCELLSEKEIEELFREYRYLAVNESNIENLESPISIVGDLHGQFYDLVELFRLNGFPPETKYLFLGDFVDRGFYSIETLLLLVCLKLRWPAYVTLVRGNHESRQVTQVYGFYDECVRKFGNANVWRLATEMFDYIPLAAHLDGILALHGGLSPNFDTMDEVRRIDRKREVPHEGPMADIMWSDPDEGISGWGVSPRGAGYLFGADIVSQFCFTNNLSLIVRAHQLVMEGFRVMFDSKLVTVWSAPNYCYRCGNVAAVMRIEDSISFQTFEAAPIDHLPARKPPLVEYFI